MSKTVIYHDNDLDGIASAVIIADCERLTGNTPICSIIRKHAGTSTSLFMNPAEARDVDSIYILDYHPSAAEIAVLDEFYTGATNKTIIDHHQIEDLMEYMPPSWKLIHPKHFAGREDLKFADESTAYMAAVLHSLVVTGTDMSAGVRMDEDGFIRFMGGMDVVEAISDRDCGRHEKEDAMNISCGITHGGDWKSYDHLRKVLFSSPGVFRKVDDPMITQIKLTGTIARATISSIAKSVSNYATKVKCGNYTASIINSCFMVSDIGYQLARQQDVDLAVVYFITSSSVVFCLRSREDAVNVGTLASRFGGGGQEHAASFSFPIGQGMRVLEHLRRGKLDMETTTYARLETAAPVL